MRSFLLGAGILVSVGAALGCSKGKKAPLPDDEPTQLVVLGAPGESADAIAERFFRQRCASCHGSGGQGDGPSGVFLKPKPRDFADPAWQAQIDDAYLTKIIVQGGKAVGKSAAMPANPELRGHDDVIGALVQKVRSLSKRSAP